MSGVADAGAASLGQRTLAWTIDLALLWPLLWWVGWPPLARAAGLAFDWLLGVQAWMLDRVLAGAELVSPLRLAQDLLADPVQGASARAQVAALTTAVLHGGLAMAAVASVYFVAFEASRWQATPGKYLLGLQVQSLDGARPTLARVLTRQLAGVASWLSLNIGHLLVALRPDRRALHDLIAGTRVQARGPMSVGGRSALAVVFAAAVLAPLWAMWRLLGVLAGV